MTNLGRTTVWERIRRSPGARLRSGRCSSSLALPDSKEVIARRSPSLASPRLLLLGFVRPGPIDAELLMVAPNRKAAGLMVVVALALFLGATTILQTIGEVADAADSAQSKADEASSLAEDVRDRVDEVEARIGG